jgi:lipopolysaccharide transport system ATP-binding protein
MPDPIVKIENIGKKYTLQHKVKYLALRDVVMDTFSRKNPRTTSEDFWALKNINFAVNKGDVVGIIGKNGSGKSTLLKILSRITPPTEGSVIMRGRVSSLLEVGTGFNPELTGRENVFLNGAILGMSQKEIRSKFDEMIDFSGIEKFLDTPVKHYSSGMYVRLAFSIAAHLQPEIMIIDEVLAVGDLEFQKKCIGKMGDVAKSGRTIFFVSHNMAAVEQLCNCCALLDEGHLIEYGPDVKKVVNRYVTEHSVDIDSHWENSGFKYKNRFFTPLRIFITDEHGNEVPKILDRNCHYKIAVEIEVEKTNPELIVGYSIYGDNGSCLYWTYNTDAGEGRNEIGELTGKVRMFAELPIYMLNNGLYTIELNAGICSKEWLLKPQADVPRVQIEVSGKLSNSSYYFQKRPTLLAPVLKWDIE